MAHGAEKGGLDLDIEQGSDAFTGRLQRAGIGAHAVDDFALLDQCAILRAGVTAAGGFHIRHLRHIPTEPLLLNSQPGVGLIDGIEYFHSSRMMVQEAFSVPKNNLAQREARQYAP